MDFWMVWENCPKLFLDGLGKPSIYRYFFSCLDVYIFLIYINIYAGLVTPAIDPFEVSGRQWTKLGLGFTSAVVLVPMLSQH
jgi:hypothetical protein